MLPFVLRSLVAGALVAGFVAPAAAQSTPESLDGVKIVTAELARDLGAKGAALIDTRTPNEFAEADFDKSADKFDLSKLPADKSAPVIFFCNSGTCWKSYKASVVARDAGYKQVGWFRGGMPEWTSKGLPTQ
ncbi:MAG: rhodanese-like domain-containing protein [Rubrivivax sp.]|nr:rhodanese-like domain-containing protein [Rubrivivax sp.]